MCSSNTKSVQSNDGPDGVGQPTTTVSDNHGRPVLQPATPNRNSPLSERRSLKKTLSLPKSISMNPNLKSNQLPISPKLKSPRQPAIKRNNVNDMTSSSDKLVLPLPTTKCKLVIPVKKSKKCLTTTNDHQADNPVMVKYSSASIVESPGSIAAARREQVAVMQVQRKMRIAHYGRSKSAKYDHTSNKLMSYSFDPDSLTVPVVNREEKRRCSFITSNSDPIYVAYHDHEWGVPTHDDKMLFELLVLTGAQVGSDWTSVLKKRQQFREAFSGFDADIVSKYSEKKITLISSEHGIEVSLVRGVVDNSKSIIEIKKSLGSFDKYIWGFVNHKPIITQYKLSHKMPVKTSKAEAISKDMVKRGFRQVGPTVIHSFMQAAGLTNDHLTTCPRHLHLTSSSSSTLPNQTVQTLL